MKVSDIKKVACLGGGVIGSSWAITFAMHGLDVALRDISEEMLAKSTAQMNQYLDSLVSAGVMTEERKTEVLSRIRLTTSVEDALQGVQFIQENGPERLPIKQSILADADKYAAPDAIYASSTSGLLISDIAANSAHPERCVGAHPYNPPHLIPLVELTRGEKSSDENVKLAYDFYQSIGKEAVLLNQECPGYIANRFQLALFREELDLVLRGVCSIEDADKALVYGPGIRWAIFGHGMIMEMGNPNGIVGMANMLGNAGNVWLKDMASWTQLPENWGERIKPGLEEEMAHFPDYMGHSNTECAAYRDKMLIEILKLHKKL